MDGRERFLAAINRQKADRLPCQVHSWMGSWLRAHLGGVDQYAAYAHFGMDPVVYVAPIYEFSPEDHSNWRVEKSEPVLGGDGYLHWTERIHTPGGVLVKECAKDKYTGWDTKHLIVTDADWDLFERYAPSPIRIDWTPVITAKNRIGPHGIVRGWPYDFGQGSPWQSFCYLYGTEPAIMAANDRPDWLAHCLEVILAKKLRSIEVGGRIPYDLVETGGGAGSSTVISPRLFRRFCLPYDRIQHQAFHDHGTKAIYHLCGGVMPMLDLVAETGADGLETMTPEDMGGDCYLAAAHAKVGDRLFFVGGFDQNAGFERGDAATVRRMVRDCFAACPNGGYICSPSDHFFLGHPDNVQAFADAAKECRY